MVAVVLLVNVVADVDVFGVGVVSVVVGVVIVVNGVVVDRVEGQW